MDELDAALGGLRAAGWPAPEDPGGDDDAELDGRELICDCAVTRPHPATAGLAPIGRISRVGTMPSVTTRDRDSRHRAVRAGRRKKQCSSSVPNRAHGALPLNYLEHDPFAALKTA
jgi:hypothetical protein